MSSKFQYAPGMPGYGTKGSNGVDGSTGIGMYITDLNGVDDQVTLTARINNDLNLWSNNALPNNRKYQTGDTFIDKQGRVYEIDLSLTNKFAYTRFYLSAAEIFALYNTPNDIAATRYSNQYIDSHIIVDSVFSKTVNEYTEFPDTIYGIKPVNFGRIEFSDYESEAKGYNPFTLFSSGIDNNNSMALVRDINTEKFRLGNLDANASTRTTDLILDFHEVTVSKDPGNIFNVDTTPGTILTNYEIDTRHLFSPMFTYDDPSALYYTINGTEASLYWDLNYVIDNYDPGDMVADLHFYQNVSSNIKIIDYPVATINSSTLIFKDIDTTGVMCVSGLISGKTYNTYMSIYCNGWQRETKRYTVTVDPISVFMINVSNNINPNIFTKQCASIANSFYVDVSSAYTYNVSKTDAGSGTSWVTITPANPRPPINSSDGGSIWNPPHDVSISVAAYSGTTDRSMIIRFTPTVGTYRGFTITQPGTATVFVKVNGALSTHFEFNDDTTIVNPPNTVTITTSSGNWVAKWQSSGTTAPADSWPWASAYSGSSGAGITVAAILFNYGYSRTDTLLFALASAPSVTLAQIYFTQYSA